MSDISIVKDLAAVRHFSKNFKPQQETFKLESTILESENIEQDLYEILYNQDVDLGVPRNLFSRDEEEDETQKQTEEDKTKSAPKKFEDAKDSDESDPWAGLIYTVDRETGEYIFEETENLISASLPSGTQGLAPDYGVSESVVFDDSSDLFGFSSECFASNKSVEPVSSDPGLSPLNDDPALESAAIPVRLTRAQASKSSRNQDSVRSLDSDDLSIDFSQFLTPESVKGISLQETGIETIKQELEASLRDMIQTTQLHSRPTNQVRLPLLRTISMEQRWQDLANFLSLPSSDGSGNLIHHHPSLAAHHHPHHPHAHHFAHPYSHAHHTPHPQAPIHSHHPYGAPGHHSHPYGSLPAAAAYSSADNSRPLLLQNAPLPTTLQDMANGGSYSSALAGTGVSLGSAVTASMNVGSNAEPVEAAGHGSYKVEAPSEMLYYQHSHPAEVNPNGDGFFTSILNDEDLQLMDMAINDGMYPMRMMDGQQGSVSVATVPGTGTSAASAAQPAAPSAVLDGASDSAVSSMGSERVPSISDNDWMESQAAESASAAAAAAGGSSSHPHIAYGMDYSAAAAAKYRVYDFGYANRGPESVIRGGPQVATPPVAQKKHQMFGKRTISEHGPLIAPDAGLVGGVGPSTPASPAASLHKYDYTSIAGGGGGGPLYSHPIPSNVLEGASGLHPLEVKYGSPMDFNHHPHDLRGMDHIHHGSAYAFRSEGSSAQRPLVRDKHRGSGSSIRHNSESSMGHGASGSGSGSESEGSSRDEKRARAMNIPLSIDEIINLPMDEFNERLSKYDLTEAQLSLIRDIRRRGKNKVAAQNCRKRKLDQILSLADEVKRVRERRVRLAKEREFLLSEKARIKEKFALLYRHVFQSLRDPDGQPYSPYEYSLQQSADGSILLVPRSAPHGSTPIDPEATHSGILDATMIPGGSGLYMAARRRTPDHKLD